MLIPKIYVNVSLLKIAAGIQGSKKLSPGCLEQVHVGFPAGLVTFHFHLPMGKDPDKLPFS